MLIAGCIAVALAAAAYLVALARLRRHEAHEHTAWWFGYARDAVNLGGALVFVGAYALGGYDGPRALVLGIALLLATYVLDWLLGKWLAWRASTWVLAVLSGGAGAATILLHARVEPAVSWLLALAAPR